MGTDGPAFGGALPPASFPPDGEVFDALVRRPGGRIERIVSAPSDVPGPWYDQGHDEFVLLFSGAADLTSADDEGATSVRLLRPGDWAWIPAGRRHRVERVRAPSIWLAVHWEAVL